MVQGKAKVSFLFLGTITITKCVFWTLKKLILQTLNLVEVVAAELLIVWLFNYAVCWLFMGVAATEHNV